MDYASDHDLNPSEEEILSFLIESHDKGEQLSIRRAADQLFVSTTSIIRLCKKLGFSGYSEFIFNLGLKVKNMQDPGPATSLHDPLVRKKEEFLSNARWTLDSIGEDSIKQFLDELKQHNLIYIYGAGFSTLFSNYLAKKLSFTDTICPTRPLVTAGRFSSITIQRYNLLIIFSRSGETGKVIEKVQIAKDKGLKTFLITGNRQSTTAALADIVFPVFDPTIESQQEFQVTSYESNMFMLIDIHLSLAIEQGIIEEY